MSFKSKVERVREQRNFGDSLTEQSHKKYVDINRLVKLYGRNGPPPAAIDASLYKDAPPITYHEALNTIRETDEKFSKLPSKIRAQFGHDPDKFQAFASNPENLQYLTEDGIIFPEAENEVSKKAQEKYEEVKPRETENER